MGKVKECDSLIALSFEERFCQLNYRYNNVNELNDFLKAELNTLETKYDRLKLKTNARKKCLRSLNRHYADQKHIIDALKSKVSCLTHQVSRYEFDVKLMNKFAKMKGNK